MTKAKSFQPLLEHLETRIAPVARAWQPAVGSNNFNTANNWSPAGVPGSGDVALFSARFTNGNASCLLPTNESVGAWQVAPSYTGTFTLQTNCTLSIGNQDDSYLGVGATYIQQSLGSSITITDGNVTWEGSNVNAARGSALSNIWLKGSASLTLDNGSPQLGSNLIIDGTATFTISSIGRSTLSNLVMANGAGIDLESTASAVPGFWINGAVNVTATSGTATNITVNVGVALIAPGAGKTFTSDATLTVGGGSVEFSNGTTKFTTDRIADIYQTGGTVQLDGGATVNCQYSVQQDGGTFLVPASGSKAYLTTSPSDGGDAVFKGTVSIGDGTGTAVLDWSGYQLFFDPSSTLNVTVNGAVSGTCSRIDSHGSPDGSGGSVATNGTLSVIDIVAAPTVGNIYYFLTDDASAFSSSWPSLTSTGFGTSASTWSQVGQQSGGVWEQGISCIT
jgi:hypothetical protein